MISGNTVQTEETEQSSDKESNKDGGKKVNEDDYADTDVLISRNGGPTGDVKVFSSPSRGIVLQLGSTTFINITKEGEILLTSDQVSLQVRDNKIFIGKEEYFEDSGYYKYHEAYHLLKFSNEKQILEQAYQEYQELRKRKQWVKPT